MTLPCLLIERQPGGIGDSNRDGVATSSTRSNRFQHGQGNLDQTLDPSTVHLGAIKPHRPHDQRRLLRRRRRRRKLPGDGERETDKPVHEHLMWGGRLTVGPLSAELPAETDAEEIGAPEHAEILPGVIEADRKAALSAVVESATEGQALEVLLIGERGGCRIDRSQVVGGGIAIAPPRSKPERRAAQTLRHPLATERESGSVVVR